MAGDRDEVANEIFWGKREGKHSKNLPAKGREILIFHKVKIPDSWNEGLLSLPPPIFNLTDCLDIYSSDSWTQIKTFTGVVYLQRLTKKNPTKARLRRGNGPLNRQFINRKL